MLPIFCGFGRLRSASLFSQARLCFFAFTSVHPKDLEDRKLERVGVGVY